MASPGHVKHTPVGPRRVEMRPMKFGVQLFVGLPRLVALLVPTCAVHVLLMPSQSSDTSCSHPLAATQDSRSNPTGTSVCWMLPLLAMFIQVPVTPPTSSWIDG